MNWVAVHRGCVAGEEFIDEQVRGPFTRWVHTHRFVATSADGSRLEDEVEYVLPGGAAGNLLGGRYIEDRLRSLFAWRHAVTRADLQRHRQAADGAPRRIAVSGAAGLIGGALVPFMRAGGNDVTTLVRRVANPVRGEIRWDPQADSWDARELSGCDAVVHLAGRSIAAGRWTTGAKAEILRSRTEPTRRLALGLAALDQPPATLLCASAIGFYGDGGNAEVDERAPAGDGFLADVTQAWEEACEPALRRGIRVVNLRFGVVLNASGGALAKLLPPFRLGLGGRVGSGRQWMSWISLDDVLGAILFTLRRGELSGPVNVVAPNPVQNAVFARSLGRVLRRPALVPFPAPAIGLCFGEMGRDLLLGGQRVVPRKLMELGFSFAHPTIDDGLRFELGKIAAI